MAKTGGNAHLSTPEINQARRACAAADDAVKRAQDALDTANQRRRWAYVELERLQNKPLECPASQK